MIFYDLTKFQVSSAISVIDKVKGGGGYFKAISFLQLFKVFVNSKVNLDKKTKTKVF